MRTSNIHDQKKLQGLPVNASPEKPIHGEIAEGLGNVMDDYMKNHSKAHAFLMTLTYPTEGGNTSDNRSLKRFLKTFKTDRARHNLDPAYLWVTEKGEDSAGRNLHHHVAVLLDGNKTRAPHKHFDVAKRVWAHTLDRKSADGLVNVGGRNGGMQGHLIRRNDEESKSEAFHHFSYLAKTSTKAGVPPGVRHWGSTRPGKREKGEK